MKRLFSYFLTVVSTFLLLWSCGGGANPDPTPEPVAPTTVTLTVSSLNAEQAGDEVTFDISAPSRPEVSGEPDWLQVKLGIFDSKTFKMSGVKVTVAANPTYEERTAELTFKAGSASAVLSVRQAGRELVKDPELPDNEAVRMARKLGLGWNMGNQFDGFYNGTWAGDKFLYPDETIWQSADAKATQATFDGVKAAGFTSVRIPVTWLKMIGEAPDYKIDQTWLNRIYEVVGYAHNAGLSVIINTHHDECFHDIIENGVDLDTRWLDIKNAVNNATLNQQIKDEIKAVWTQIAEKFADCGDWLVFESFNEINDGGWGWSADFRADPTRQCNILNEWNQVFVNAVRATGGNNATRWLGVPTYSANPEFEKYAKLPEDSAGKLMLAVHFYDPSSYTIGDEQYSDWGHTGASGKKASNGDEDHVKEVFNNLYTKYVEKNVPVYLGEFGCSMRAESNARAWKFYLYYMEYVTKAARVFGLPAFLWDNGAASDGKEQHGYIHHGTGSYIGNSKKVIDVMVKGMTSTEPTYTLQSVYDSAPVF